jgi:2-dehydro-3-deoxygalactonokinase
VVEQVANYITIDGGTTNTRISLVKDFKVLGRVKFPVGARAGIGNSSILRDTIRSGIRQLLQEYEIQASEICCILAAGMITSEFGLYKLDHILVPAGIGELHGAMKQVVLEDISEIPFVFVPGVKVLAEDIRYTDMMRGEEAELVGLMKKGDGECVYILPGSHSKLIQTDDQGRIEKNTESVMSRRTKH